MSLDNNTIDSFLKQIDGLVTYRNVFSLYRIGVAFDMHPEMIKYYKSFPRFATVYASEVQWKFSQDFRKHIMQHHSDIDGHPRTPSTMKGIKTWILDYAK